MRKPIRRGVADYCGTGGARSPNPNLSVAVLLTALSAVPVDARQRVDLPGADRALSGQPETVYTVGREEGRDWEVFSFVPAVAFDADGNLYVVDRDNARVLAFGPGGRFLRQIGKKGQGPGELGLPMGVAVLPDGRIAVFDLGNTAVSVFSRTGEYQTLARPDPQVSGMRGTDFAASARGAGVFMMGTNIRIPGPGQRPEVLDSVPIVLVPIGEGSTRAVFRAPAAKPNLSASGGGNRMQVRMTPPPEFSPVVTWSPLPDGGLAVSYGANYEIHVVRPDGRLAWTLKRPLTARRTTDRDRERAKELRRAQLESGTGTIRVTNENGVRRTMAGGSMPKEQIDQILANMTFSETIPVVRRIQADREGRIWIQRDGGLNGERVIDIVTFNGVYVGTVKGMELPHAFGPNGLAAFIESDDLGVQRVTVRRLPRSWRAPVPSCTPPNCR